VYRHAVEHEEAENIGIFTQPKSLNLRQALIALPHA
jgi:hypothetical protein